MSSKKFCEYKFIAGKKKGQQCGRFLRKNSENACFQHRTKIDNKPPEDVEKDVEIVTETIETIPEVETFIEKSKPVKIENKSVNKKIDLSKPVPVTQLSISDSSDFSVSSDERESTDSSDFSCSSD